MPSPSLRGLPLPATASLAKAERGRISERTKAGLARVRGRGTRLGRPALSDNVWARFGELVRANPDITACAIAKAVGCDVKTAAKYAGGARSAA